MAPTIKLALFLALFGITNAQNWGSSHRRQVPSNQGGANNQHGNQRGGGGGGVGGGQQGGGHDVNQYNQWNKWGANDNKDDIWGEDNDNNWGKDDVSYSYESPSYSFSMSYEDDSQWPNQDDNWKMNRGHHGRKWNSRTNNRCDYRHPPADGNWNNFNCQFPDDDKTWRTKDGQRGCAYIREHPLQRCSYRGHDRNGYQRSASRGCANTCFQYNEQQYQRQGQDQHFQPYMRADNQAYGNIH